jgi:hypothetical protein
MRSILIRKVSQSLLKRSMFPRAGTSALSNTAGIFEKYKNLGSYNKQNL